MSAAVEYSATDYAMAYLTLRQIMDVSGNAEVRERTAQMIDDLRVAQEARGIEPAATFAHGDADRAAGAELDLSAPAAADRRDGERVSPGPHKPLTAGFDSQPCYQNDPYALWRVYGGEA